MLLMFAGLEAADSGYTVTTNDLLGTQVAPPPNQQIVADHTPTTPTITTSENQTTAAPEPQSARAKSQRRKARQAASQPRPLTTPEREDLALTLATELDQVWSDEPDDQFAADISLNFENASLLNFLKKIETIFNVSFMFDEDLKASGKDSKDSKAGKELPAGTGPYDQPKDTRELASKSGLENSRISFATNQPLTKKELWHLTDQFLQVAGYARVRIPGVKQAIYRITNLSTALQEVLPVLINVTPQAIHETGVIRYVYFLRNSTPQQMLEVLDKLKSKSARIIPFTNLKALIFTDTADNIKSLMQIVQELDQANTPEMLSVIKLQKADANEIADLIKRLAGTKEGDRYGYQSPFLRTNKLSTTLKEARIIVESRANTLLVLGSRAAIATVEEIVREFDTDLQKPKNNIWVVPLNFMSAKQMAEILNNVTQFGTQHAPPAGNIPGQARLQGTERLFGQMQFEPEAQGNNLIVRGTPEDYQLILEVIKQLDRKQPQVAIEVLIVNLKTSDNQGLWSQWNSAKNRSVNVATSGFANLVTSGVKTAPVSGSLITNLLGLAQTAPVGSTLLALGKESAWAILGVLNSFAHTDLLANPFLMTTNKYPARISIGQTRRVQSGQVISTGGPGNEYQSLKAALELDIIPQINSDGVINLEISVVMEEFSQANNSGNLNAGDTIKKSVHTNTNVGNGEVLALGGFVKRSTITNETSVPVLGKLPLIGFLFKNRSTYTAKESLLIFITPRLVLPQDHKQCSYTLNKSELLQNALLEIEKQETIRDPVVKWFFKVPDREITQATQKFIDQRVDTVARECAVPMPAVAQAAVKAELKAQELARKYDSTNQSSESQRLAALRTREQSEILRDTDTGTSDQSVSGGSTNAGAVNNSNAVYAAQNPRSKPKKLNAASCAPALSAKPSALLASVPDDTADPITGAIL